MNFGRICKQNATQIMIFFLFYEAENNNILSDTYIPRNKDFLKAQFLVHFCSCYTYNELPDILDLNSILYANDTKL